MANGFRKRKFALPPYFIGVERINLIKFRVLGLCAGCQIAGRVARKNGVSSPGLNQFRQVIISLKLLITRRTIYYPSYIFGTLLRRLLFALPDARLFVRPFVGAPRTRSQVGTSSPSSWVIIFRQPSLIISAETNFSTTFWNFYRQLYYRCFAFRGLQF